jgi:uncharacterized repeat protein (TIGR02059 family)
MPLSARFFVKFVVPLLAISSTVCLAGGNYSPVPIIPMPPTPPGVIVPSPPYQLFDRTAPVALTASISGNTLVLQYNESLDSAHFAQDNAFSIAIDGMMPVTPFSVAVSGQAVTLTLVQPVMCGASVTLTYTDPSINNDVAATQDRSGNDAASLSQMPVTNQTAPSSAAMTYTPNAGTAFGSSDASASIGLDNQYMIIGDDEMNVLRIYPRTGGAAVLEWDYGLNLPSGNNELDLEASARIGDHLYFTSSLSNKKSGATDPNRNYLFETQVSGTGLTTQFTFLHYLGGIREQLVNWDVTNGHGLGANYFGFANAVNGVVPEAVGGFSIEGMSTAPDGQYLWLAFRAPQTDTLTRSKALIVPVRLSDLFTAATPTFGAPIQIDLGGRGIRSINKVADGSGYLIVAGPAGSASSEVPNDFHLFTWNGDANSAPVERDNDLDSLLAVTGGSFESTVAPASTTAGTCIQLIQDNGDTVWPGQTAVSKDLPPESQQFQGNRIKLGSVFVQTAAPQLMSSNPANGATDASVITPLTLHFDRGVLAGSGDFVIKKASDNSIVDTLSVGGPSVVVAYNTVTVKPTLRLAPDTDYYVEAVAGVIKDHNGKNWAGLTSATALAFKTAAPISYSLLITEVNSNATGGDFFELYNFGSTAIDLSNWRWDDSAADFNDSSVATFASGTSIAPGQRLVVVEDTSDTVFRADWGLGGSVTTVAFGGPGLGKGDAVVLFNAGGQVAAAMNYSATALAASDGAVINPVTISVKGVPVTITDHAGIAVNNTAGTITKGTSAVWDGVSTNSPAYKQAVIGALNAYKEAGDASSIGSPGM